MPDPIIGPRRTYGRNRIGRGFSFDANIDSPGTENYLGNAVRTTGTGPMKIVGRSTNVPVTSTNTTRKPGLFSKLFNQDTLGKVGKFGEELSPYISNISNAFRKAPRPTVPVLDSFTNLSKVDLSNEKANISRITNAANKSTERNIDSNTAEAVKAFNRGQEFNQLSSVNERENNANVGISNQQAMMDAQVKNSNVERWNDYGDAKTAADIADVRERSANVANFGDKYTLIGNEKRKAQVERDKTRILSSLFTKSGVLSRQAREWKASGVEDPLGMNYSYSESDEDYNKRKDVKAYGGMLRKVPNRKLYV